MCILQSIRGLKDGTLDAPGSKVLTVKCTDHRVLLSWSFVGPRLGHPTLNPKP